MPFVQNFTIFMQIVFENSDRAVYNDLNPRDGGQLLYPMCTAAVYLVCRATFIGTGDKSGQAGQAICLLPLVWKMGRFMQIITKSVFHRARKHLMYLFYYLLYIKVCYNDNA